VRKEQLSLNIKYGGIGMIVDVRMHYAEWLFCGTFYEPWKTNACILFISCEGVENYKVIPVDKADRKCKIDMFSF